MAAVIGHKNKSLFDWLPAILFAGLCFLCLLPAEFVPEQLCLSHRLLGYIALIMTGMLLSVLLSAAPDDSDSRQVCFHSFYRQISWVVIVTVFGVAGFSLVYYYLGHSTMVTGLFDNPAGVVACIAVAAPFVLILRQTNAGKTGSVLITLFLLVTVVLSQSRAGFFSMMTWIAVCLSSKLPWKRRTKVILILSGFIALFLFAYFLKKDSADGRLLIWQCSWEMIKDQPLFGYGHNGFMAHYMDYQANYFVRYPNSPYQALAGNINHPFNGLLLIAIRYGCVGLMLLFVFCYWLFRCFLCGRDKTSSQISALSLLSVAVLSMFSYPFSYPYVWIIVLMDIVVLVFNRYSVLLSSERIRLISKAAMAVCLVFAVLSVPIVVKTVKWQKATKHLKQQKASALMEMDSLMDTWKLPARCLYNYAIALYNAGYNEEALKIAEQCREKNADYELDCFLSLLYRKTNHFHEAENCCLRASKMCPSRLYPHYLLATLYQSAGMEAEARRVADMTLKMPIKVQNQMTDSLLMEMRLILNPVKQ